jgi:uncharacterized cupin superfamily protein
MSKAIKATDLEGATFNPFPEPFKSNMGQALCRGLGDHFNLSQFGINMEVLEPNAKSGLRHWHTNSDEFIFILSGNLILVTNDNEQHLSEGMCIGFPAGEENGHMLVNQSNAKSTFLVIGTRIEKDEAFYPDDDFKWVVKPTGDWVASRKDGSEY